MRFTLVQKLVASYAAMALFTMAALSSSILGLYSLNRTARDIAHNNLTFILSVNKLRDSIVAQERYASKYFILKSPEFFPLFQRRQTEFLQILDSFATSNHLQEKAALTPIYTQFREASASLFSGRETSTQHLQDTSTRVVNALDALYGREQALLTEKLDSADRRESDTVKLALTLSLCGFILAIGVAAFTILSISRAIRQLQKATHRIAAGDFDYTPAIPGGDEIGALAADFTRMAARLKVLEQMSLDASPLTRLPGNIAIERALNKRLAEKKPFAICYGDLDNFKAYNDRYGYVKASEIIKITAEIIHEAAHRLGDDETFIGHVGGDDFVVVLDCPDVDKVCKEIIARFDAEIVNHYSAEDVARGAIEGVDRYGVPRTFPIMSISIAVIVCEPNEYDSAVEIARAAAQIKDHAKGMPGSNYFVNRRKENR